jgi:hypothetical protein
MNGFTTPVRRNSFRARQNCGIVIDPLPLFLCFRNRNTARGSYAFHRRSCIESDCHQQAGCDQPAAPDALPAMNNDISA